LNNSKILYLANNILKPVSFLTCLFIFLSVNSFALDEPVAGDTLLALFQNADAKDSIEILTDLGRQNFKNDRHQVAIQQFYDALKLSEKIGDKNSKSTLLNNIAAIYYHNDDHENALKYFIQSYELEKELGRELEVSKSLNNIAIIYNELGDYEESLQYYKDALEIRTKLADEVGIATIHNNMGLVYVKLQKYNDAIDQYNQAVEIYLEHGQVKSLANTYGNLSRAYLFKKDYGQADHFVQRSFEAIGDNDFLYIERDNYETLYAINKELGNYVKALEYYQKFDGIQDSLNSEIIAGQIEKLTLQYESERKELENIQLKRESEQQTSQIKFQNILVISIILVLLLVSALALMHYKNSRTRKKSIEILEQQKAEIEKKNEELDKLNQVKNKLFSVISHEVRSPLNSLLGTVELLTSGFLSPEEFFKLSTELKQKVNQTTIFLNNILVWAKSQMQGLNPVKEEFEINDLINETLDLLKEQADMKGVEIDRELGEEIKVKADKNMIGIVIKNLISNAIKFTSQGEKICVHSKRNGNFAIINVVDQGVGIAKENHEKILGNEEYSTRGTAQEVGTGLGLVLSKNFIEENGGKIWLESEEGVGSTFSFTVPLEDQVN